MLIIEGVAARTGLFSRILNRSIHDVVYVMLPNVYYRSIHKTCTYSIERLWRRNERAL